MTQPPRRLAVVLPCKNEAATLEACLRALRDQDPRPEAVIVVDNGSTDGSQDLAQTWADVVVHHHGDTIAHLRNLGAAQAPPVDAIGFVDADCEVAPGWAAAVLAGLAEADLVGSRLSADQHGPWVARRWAALESGGAAAQASVWSGQMALRWEWFDRLGGFDARLATGEDSDLSQRLRAAGGTIAQQSGMVAIHHGFPGTLRAFITRERWHTSTAGWFARMSRRSRTLVLAAAGGCAALLACAGWVAWHPGDWPLLAAVSILAGLAVPGLGWLMMRGRSPVLWCQDGTLIALWALVRVSRLPRR